jgi:YVTN family beta-propeller protein
VPLGAGAHAVAFDDAGATAFVTNRASGTVTVADAVRLTRVADVPVGARPASVAYSAAAGAAYVVVEGDGSLVAVDGARRAVSGRIPLGPGAQLVRAAPAPGGHHAHGAKPAAKPAAKPVAAADPHAAHGGAGSAAAAGRLLFVTSPGTKAVHVVDAAERRVLRTMRFENTPDRVAFTGAFAYLRFADSPKLRMVSLDDPMTGGFGSLDVFEAGQKAPGDAAGELGEPVAPAPDMPDAIYAMNAAERMVYYYHYMEGMPIPSGGLTTYHYEPRAVLVAGKALRERGPGAYSATVRVDEPGEYDLVLLVPSPRVVQCFPMTVRADSAGPKVRAPVALRQLPDGRDLRAGVTDTVRFELVDAKTGKRRADVTQLQLLVTATNGWRQQARARHVGDGVFEVALAVPDRGAYYVSFAAPSLGITYNDRRPAVLRASAR